MWARVNAFYRILVGLPFDILLRLKFYFNGVTNRMHHDKSGSGQLLQNVLYRAVATRSTQQFKVFAVDSKSSGNMSVKDIHH